MFIFYFEVDHSFKKKMFHDSKVTFLTSYWFYRKERRFVMLSTRYYSY